MKLMSAGWAKKLAGKISRRQTFYLGLALLFAVLFAGGYVYWQNGRIINTPQRWKKVVKL